MDGTATAAIRSKKTSHDCVRDNSVVYANGHGSPSNGYRYYGADENGASPEQQVVERSWNSIDASHFAKNTCNPIRKFVEDPELQPNPEKSVIALSIGDPTVFGNMEPCPEIVSAVERALHSMKCHGYIPSVGTKQAREAVAKYSSINGLQVDPNDVIMTCGASHALEMCVVGFCNSGDNIVMPRPGFSVYKTHAESMGVEARFYDLDPTQGWEVDLRSLRKAIDNKTRAIIVNNPSNPCGSVFSKEHLKDIIQVAREYHLPIIADEIYEHFVFSGRVYHPMASLSPDVPIVSCSGLTKRFLVPGWRTGWIIVHDRNGALRSVKQGLAALSTKIMGGNALIQGAITEILKETPQTFFDSVVKIVEDNATLAFNAISSIPGLKPIMPQGAMYMMVGVDLDRFKEFPNDSVFCKELFRQESVMCMPGMVFAYPNYFRIVLTVPQEMILDACDRLSAFCDRHAKYF